MSEKEARLRGYIEQVALMEVPLMKLITAMMVTCNNQIPENATLGGLINFYINKIENITEKSEDDSQENYDKVYDEFINILNNVVEPAIAEETNKELEKNIDKETIEVVNLNKNEGI